MPVYAGTVSKGEMEDDGADHCSQSFSAAHFLWPTSCKSGPTPLKSYLTTPLLAEYEGEEKGLSLFWKQNRQFDENEDVGDHEDYDDHHDQVIYLASEELDAFCIKIKGGLIVDSMERPVSTGPFGQIFVMNPQGHFFLKPPEEKRDLYHSSLAAGSPVAAAGVMIIEKGRLVKMTDQSGHYQPPRHFILQAKERLKALGVDDSFKMEYFSSELK